MKQSKIVRISSKSSEIKILESASSINEVTASQITNPAFISYSSFFTKPKPTQNSTPQNVEIKTDVATSSYVTPVSKQEKLEKRQANKVRKKAQKEHELYLAKLQKIRCPNAGKVKVIDEKLMAQYRNAMEVCQPAPNLTTDNNAVKHILKTHTQQRKKREQLKIDVSKVLLDTRPKSARSKHKTVRIVKTATLIRSKGKRREIPRKKFSKLKKSILRIRRERLLQLQSEVVVEETADALDKISLKVDGKGQEAQPVILETVELPKNTVSEIKHSRNFRPYCNHFTTKELCSLAESLLQNLFRFQERAHKKNEVKAKAKKRYIVGLKDVNKLLMAKQLKFIMIAPDMEPNKGEGGLDATVEVIKATAETQQVPYIFALKRRKMGYILHKKVPVSCVGILFYDGCEEIVKKLIELVGVEREKYKNFGK